MNIHRQFVKGGISENEFDPNPIMTFKKWFEHALNLNVREVMAMTLTTVSSDLRPSGRIVYLRDIRDDGFVFFTNYRSKKARDMAGNPNVSLNLFWRELEQQIRVDGVAKSLENTLSDEYFANRPRGSQIGAWASDQSNEIDSREALEELFIKYESKFQNRDVPRPPHWGGYVVIPESVEFWQGREHRLHDRIVYYKNEQALWERKRLQP